MEMEQAYRKIRHFCAYQERCHADVKEKLYGMGLYKARVEEIISRLIEDDYLNEERFAIQYAGGKFRIKHWGRNKIRYALKQLAISDYCIKKAIGDIADDEYMRVLQKLIQKKRLTLKTDKNQNLIDWKIKNYLIQKGYESSWIDRAVDEMTE